MPFEIVKDVQPSYGYPTSDSRCCTLSGCYATTVACSLLMGVSTMLGAINTDTPNKTECLIAGASLFSVGICCAITPVITKCVKKCFGEMRSLQSGYMPIVESKEPNQTMKV